MSSKDIPRRMTVGIGRQQRCHEDERKQQTVRTHEITDDSETVDTHQHHTSTLLVFAENKTSKEHGLCGHRARMKVLSSESPPTTSDNTSTQSLPLSSTVWQQFQWEGQEHPQLDASASAVKIGTGRVGVENGIRWPNIPIPLHHRPIVHHFATVHIMAGRYGDLKWGPMMQHQCHWNPASCGTRDADAPGNCSKHHIKKKFYIWDNRVESLSIKFLLDPCHLSLQTLWWLPPFSVIRNKWKFIAHIHN